MIDNNNKPFKNTTSKQKGALQYNVYDLSGKKIISQRHSLAELRTGTYIINGKKTIIPQIKE